MCRISNSVAVVEAMAPPSTVALEKSTGANLGNGGHRGPLPPQAIPTPAYAATNPASPFFLSATEVVESSIATLDPEVLAATDALSESPADTVIENCPLDGGAPLAVDAHSA